MCDYYVFSPVRCTCTVCNLYIFKAIFAHTLSLSLPSPSSLSLSFSLFLSFSFSSSHPLNPLPKYMYNVQIFTFHYYLLFISPTLSSLSVLFLLLSRESISQIKQKASEAREVLRTWSQSYLDVRKKIEQSGRDARWEFDRKKLFERTEYVSQICSDIYNVAQVNECVCV